MQSFSSNLAVNPAHLLVKEVNKSKLNKSTRNRNTINFCLVLAPLGKFNKVNCSSFTPPKKHLIGAILNILLTLIPEAETRGV